MQFSSILLITLLIITVTVSSQVLHKPPLHELQTKLDTENDLQYSISTKSFPKGTRGLLSEISHWAKEHKMVIFLVPVSETGDNIKFRFLIQPKFMEEYSFLFNNHKTPVSLVLKGLFQRHAEWIQLFLGPTEGVEYYDRNYDGKVGKLIRVENMRSLIQRKKAKDTHSIVKDEL
jgi:hypothetical protein